MSATLVYAFDVTIPAGTPKTAPLVTPVTFEPNIVDSIEWLFPEGCQGTVGIQIGARSVAVLPPNASQFFVRSGDSHGFDIADLHTTGDWSIIGYNTGNFQHTIHVTFKAHRYVRPSAPDILILDAPGLIGLGEG